MFLKNKTDLNYINNKTIKEEKLKGGIKSCSISKSSNYSGKGLANNEYFNYHGNH